MTFKSGSHRKQTALTVLKSHWFAQSQRVNISIVGSSKLKRFFTENTFSRGIHKVRANISILKSEVIFSLTVIETKHYISIIHFNSTRRSYFEISKSNGIQAMNRSDEKDWVTCPYNEQHVVPYSRMPYHLMKCKTKYTGPPLDTCPFNATHLVPSGTLEQHFKTCVAFYHANRERFERGQH